MNTNIGKKIAALILPILLFTGSANAFNGMEACLVKMTYVTGFAKHFAKSIRFNDLAFAFAAYLLDEMAEDKGFHKAARREPSKLLKASANVVRLVPMLFAAHELKSGPKAFRGLGVLLPGSDPKMLADVKALPHYRGLVAAHFVYNSLVVLWMFPYEALTALTKT